MGVDIGTYRCHIGTFRHGTGMDVVLLKIHVNYSGCLKMAGTVIFIGLLLLMAGIESNPGPTPGGLAMQTDRFQDKRYGNWLKVGLSLVYMKEGLEDFVEKQSKSLHTKIQATVQQQGRALTGIPCTRCTAHGICKRARKWTFKNHCPVSVCDAWIDEILKYHIHLPCPDVSWDNTNPQMWPTDPWEVAKVFQPYGCKGHSSPSDCDAAAILTLMKNCTHFCPFVSNVALLQSIKDIRNKTMHSKDMLVDDTAMIAYINTVIQLLQDQTHLAHLFSCQEAVRKIEELRDNITDLSLNRELELMVLHQRTSAIQTDVGHLNHAYQKLNKEISNIKSENEKTKAICKEYKEKISKLEEMEIDIKKLSKENESFTSFMSTNGLDVQHIKASIHDNQFDIEQLIHEVENNNSVRRHHEVEIQNLKTSININATEYHVLKQDMDKKTETVFKRVHGLKRKHNEMAECVNDQATIIEQQTNTINKHEKEIEIIYSRQNVQEKEVTQAKLSLKDLGNKQSGLIDIANKTTNSLTYQGARLTKQEKLSRRKTHSKDSKWLLTGGQTEDDIVRMVRLVQNTCVDRTELNRKIEQARSRLTAHAKELERYQLPYKTKITEEITNKLFRNKLVILTGIPGIGKSHLALNSMKLFLIQHPEKQPLIMRVPSDIEKVLDTRTSFVLLIDDILGPVSLDTIELGQWNNYTDTLLSQIENDNVFAIITLRRTILERCTSEKLAKLLKKDNVLYLDKDLIYREEMKSILELYAASHNMPITTSQVETITRFQNIGIGFPFLCKFMKGHESIDDLFSRPIDYIKDDILSLQKHNTPCFVALLLTLLCGLPKFTRSQELTIRLDALVKYFRSSSLDKRVVFEAAHTLDSTYLCYHVQERYFTFIHDIIAESTFEAAIESIPCILIQYCPLEYLVKFIQPFSSNKHAISPACNTDSMQNRYNIFHKDLLYRFKQTIAKTTTSKELLYIAGSSLWGNKEFINIAFKKLSFSEFSNCDSNGLSLMCYFSRLGFTALIKRILSLRAISNSPSADLFQAQIQTAIKEASMSAQFECVKYLVTKTGVTTDEMMFAAVKGGDVNILALLLRVHGEGTSLSIMSFKKDGKSLLIEASENETENMIRYLCESCKALIQQTDCNNCNAAHYSARKGNNKCLIYLLEQGINPSSLTNKGQTILHLASAAGHLHTVKFICDTYNNMLSILDYDGYTAAHCASNSGTVDCLEYIIFRGVDPTTVTKYGYTLLHEAAKGGNPDVIQYICINYNSLLHVKDHAHMNSLHWAAIGGSLESIKLLIGKGMDPNKKAGAEESLLHLAALNGNIEVIEYLCETYKYMLQETDNHSRNSAHYAAAGGTLECLKYLIDQGIDINEKTGTGESLLHRASLGGNIEVVKYLCETYTHMLHMKDDNSMNSAHFAAAGSTVECLKYLIDQGIDPNERSRTGESLLHRASLGGNIAVVKYLCDTYKDMLHMKDDDSKNSAHCAVNKGTVDCLKYLIDQGLDPNERTCTGESLLHRASVGGNIAVVKYLCETYTHMLHMKDDDSRNSVHYSANKGTVDCLRYLIDQGIDPNERTCTGESLLHIASLGGNIEVVKYLCETYTHMLHMKDDDSRNSAHHAANKGTVDCLKYLVDQGIDPNERTGNGESLLHTASLGGKIAVVKYLCETYKDMLHMKDDYCRNSAHCAAARGTVDCLRYLIDQGIDPNEMTGTGESLLHRASLGGKIAIVKYLCETYTHMLHMKDNGSRNSAHYAANKGTVDCLKYLIDQGIDPNEMSGNGESLLHRASLGGNIAVVKYLCETYKDMLHMKDYDSRNSAHCAVNKGTVECLKYLIDQGIDPNERTGIGESLLHRASLCGNIAVVKYLCETYTHMLHMNTDDSMNSAHYAVCKGKVDCLKYLIDQGIYPN